MSPNSIQALGVALSIVLAFVPYIISKRTAANSRVAEAANMGLVIALVGTVLSMTLAHDVRIGKELASAIPKLRQEPLKIIAQDLEKLDNQFTEDAIDYGPISSVIMEHVRSELSRSIRDARYSSIAVESKEETINLASDLMDKARDKILVTSYILPEDWWLTSAGQAYDSRTSGTSSRKKVNEFDRIFVVDSEQEIEQLRPLIESQQRAGIHVKIAYSSDIGADLCRDFAVIDDVIVGEIELDGARRFTKGSFWLQTTKAQDFTDLYRRIEVWAKDP